MLYALHRHHASLPSRGNEIAVNGPPRRSGTPGPPDPVRRSAIIRVTLQPLRGSVTRRHRCLRRGGQGVAGTRRPARSDGVRHVKLPRNPVQIANTLYNSNAGMAHEPCRPATTSRVRLLHAALSQHRRRGTEAQKQSKHESRQCNVHAGTPDGQWHRAQSHTRHALTHGQWLSHTSCLSVLFISIHRDATSLRLSASSDRKSASSHMLRCCLRWTDRSAAALRTCLPFSAPAESCERVPATVVLQPFAARRSSHMLPAEEPLGSASPRNGRTTGPASHRMPHALRYRLHNRLAAACTPPPARRLLAACTPPAPPSAGRHSRGRDLVATVLESVARRVLAGTGRVRLRLSEESRRSRLELTRVAGTRGQGAVGGEGG